MSINLLIIDFDNCQSSCIYNDFVVFLHHVWFFQNIHLLKWPWYAICSATQSTELKDWLCTPHPIVFARGGMCFKSVKRGRFEMAAAEGFQTSNQILSIAVRAQPFWSKKPQVFSYTHLFCPPEDLNKKVTRFVLLFSDTLVSLDNFYQTYLYYFYYKSLELIQTAYMIDGIILATSLHVL